MTSVLVDRLWKQLLWIAAFAALAYLPHLLQLTYHRDDWYYAYDALVGPAGVFRFMFAEDRPARGPFFELYYALFGVTPLPYHLATLFWRTLGGAALTWLFHLLWPRRVPSGLTAGILFAIYPGYTWWVQGIEYQPMLASAALMVLSLALTVLAIRQPPGITRLAAIVGAILSGWLYLSLVEYAAGMEVLRLLLILLSSTQYSPRKWRPRLLRTLRLWLPYLLIPAAFAFWRFFIFVGERRATDLGLQLGAFLAQPLNTGFDWLVGSVLSLVNVALAAWVEPLLGGYFGVGSRQQLLGLALAVLGCVLAYWLLRRTRHSTSSASGDDGWQLQCVWLGIAGILLGIAPVIIANRVVTLPRFSHYALPASLGLALLIVGLTALLSNRRWQAALLSLLIGLSVLTHQGLGAAAVQEQRTIAAFWHQMAWRAPSLAPSTTLLAFYPGIDYGTDSDVVWGPANVIYHPQPQPDLPVQVTISALTADRGALNSVLAGRPAVASTYRAHTMSIDPGNVLLIVQSSTDACVRVQDARWPTFSVHDDPALRTLAPSSRVDNIQARGAAVIPRAIFGPEPARSWCYYFELASLAAQQGSWEDVVSLQHMADALGLHPNDQIEWMPFLQAHAFLGDRQAMKDLSTRINTERLYRQQACVNLRAMPTFGYPLDSAIQAYADGLFCGGAQ